MPYPSKEGHMKHIFHSACKRVRINHKIKEGNGCISWGCKNNFFKQTNKQVVYTELTDVNTNLGEPVHLSKFKGMFVNLGTVKNSQLPAVTDVLQSIL